MTRLQATDRTLTDPRTDLITVLLGTWLMIGIFLDGYAHTNIIDELESFFTPWHAVFYSGFLATAGWICWAIYQRIRQGHDLIDAVPAGYGLAVLGIGVFAVGGIGDGVWHTILGIEVGIDALLSPTHLLLFLGILLILTTPLRTARLRDPEGKLTGSNRMSVSLSVTLITALLAFFFFYLWAPGHSYWAEQPFDPVTGEGELFLALGIGAIMLSNLIMLAPLAVVLARWQPPTGMTTIAWGAVNALTAAAFDLDLTMALVVGLAGGVAADALVLALGAGPRNRSGSVLVMTVSPLVAWSAYFLVIGMSGELTWPPEVWVGAIVFGVLAGLGLATLALPRASAVRDPEPEPVLPNLP